MEIKMKIISGILITLVSMNAFANEPLLNRKSFQVGDMSSNVTFSSGVNTEGKRTAVIYIHNFNGMPSQVGLLKCPSFEDPSSFDPSKDESCTMPLIGASTEFKTLTIHADQQTITLKSHEVSMDYQVE